ncbi:cell division protein CpoB, partial [Candidatus Frankia alpina]
MSTSASPAGDGNTPDAVVTPADRTAPAAAAGGPAVIPAQDPAS